MIRGMQFADDAVVQATTSPNINNYLLEVVNEVAYVGPKEAATQ